MGIILFNLKYEEVEYNSFIRRYSFRPLMGIILFNIL